MCCKNAVAQTADDTTPRADWLARQSPCDARPIAVQEHSLRMSNMQSSLTAREGRMQSCSAGRAACHHQIQLNMAISATFRHLLTFVDWTLPFFSDFSRDAARLLHSHCSRR